MISDKNETFFQAILRSNAPWIEDPAFLVKPQDYRREAYFKVEQELHAKHGMAVLIKGPRRVGKTEIQKQLIWDLIRVRNVEAKRVLYLSFDDVQILSERQSDRALLVQDTLDTWAHLLGAESFDRIQGPAYCFFDEVQAVDDWAHLIKNRVERNKNVRIVLSGSAAHSIFDKALRTLMGRVIDVRLTTFSFREFLERRGSLDEETSAALREAQGAFERTLDAASLHAALSAATAKLDGLAYRGHITEFLNTGGFPQLWQMGEKIIERAQFVDENYVKKVTLEDLMLLQQIKKPEMYQRLMRYLFARPGAEFAQNKVATTLGTTSVTLAEAMRLLGQTDLFIFVERFSQKAAPLKLRDIKVYPIDMMLTFAMTKIAPSLDAPTEKGAIAKSLAAQVMARFQTLSAIAFMKSENVQHPGEIDFYLRADLHDCPIEVKYQPEIRAEDTAMLRRIIAEKRLPGGILIGVDGWNVNGAVYSIPLWAWMLLA